MFLIHCVLAATDLNILKFANPKEMFFLKSDGSKQLDAMQMKTFIAKKTADMLHFLNVFLRFLQRTTDFGSISK